ncbi:lysoplasmalogenase [Panacibacter ginsenosidivorans]|uniref:Lysoplasmalogenase n=1 Tax=Panacibacter ginsenosidivorans TaxID=1813871 RepID=A0A5B8VHF3_9BACT|nr:lysoplasmalogenase [Panacibacter ginsenosidivorans]QEC70026.1 lysoplasmalogenase [Panacibacter ginsenosidivorans]
MKNSELILAILFWTFLVADCILMTEGLHEYRIYTKTLLVPILLIGIYTTSQETKHRKSKVITTLAFFFCFLGDFFLLSDDDKSYFILGLSSFLLAHLFFIVFFLRLKKISNKYRLFLSGISALVFSYVGVLLFLIWKDVTLQNLQIPVVVYAFILGLMLIAAVHTINNKSIQKLSRYFFIPGAVLFILSDSLLALYKFAITFRYGNILVMVTYAGALFLLYLGVMRFLKK